MSKDISKQENVHKGHRKRMRDNFFLRGFDGVEDHEIIEMLLYFVLPQRDTNQIAHSLINHFGSFAAVLEADRADLVQLPYISDNVAFLLKLVLPTYKRYMESLLREKKKFENTEELVDYLRSKYADTSNECVYALFFDAENNLIICRKLNEGDISTSLFDLRKLAALSLETKATSVIISHNHPHGITLPSREDVAVTEKAYNLLKAMKVNLLDHIIVSETAYTSMLKMPKFTHIFYGLDPLFPEDDND